MLSKYAVHHRVVVSFCVFLIIAGGIWSYFHLGRLEDPEFSVKTALVVTLYPGASAQEVEEHVTEIIERTAQQIKGFKTVRSQSRPGISFVFVDLQDKVQPEEMPNIWQDLRNKIAMVRQELPVESLPSVVQDDFGEVYGIVFAITAEGFSDAELRDRAKELQKDILLVDQVRRAVIWGLPEERIEVEISRARMSELKIHPLAVILSLQRQNLTTDTGNMTLGGEIIRIDAAGTFQSLEEIENLILPAAPADELINAAQQVAKGTSVEAVLAQLSARHDVGTRQIRLGDIATIRRLASDEPTKIMRSNGKKAVALAVSPVPGGNVIKMGENIRKRLEEITQNYPVGHEINVISYQPDNVKLSIHAFTKNLYEAIFIVTIVVMIAMGWKSGLLITSSLFIVILGTLCALVPIGVDLQRASLGAFIIAIGILVDDAVVVGDLILVRMQRGMAKTEACIEGARRASMQLLGATIVGALAFWPVYLSPDMTGEYAGSIFIVLAISLMISWVVAMMQTPVVYYLTMRPRPLNTEAKDPHAGPVYQMYRKTLELILRHRFCTIAVLIGLLVTSGYGFTKIPQIFFPRAQRTQFMIDYWLPEGSSIKTVSADIQQVEDYLMKLEGVTNVGSFIGSGPPRFYLPYEPELPCSSYAQIVVNVDSMKRVDELLPKVHDWLRSNFPQAATRTQRFALGPTTKSEVELRISGPDPAVLHKLAAQVEDIFNQNPRADFIWNDWRQKVPTWCPQYSQSKGTRASISRAEMMFALRWATRGIPAATFDDGENLLPIIVRSTPQERNNTEFLQSLPVWGRTLDSVPISQITDNTGMTWEEGRICRRNRIPTITVGADPMVGDWSALLKELKQPIRSLDIPDGYRLEWGGQFEKSVKASRTMLSFLPITMIFMMIIVVALFNGFRQTIIIAMTFPLAAIGITFGMLVFQKPFGFMALIGAMSLLGMMVRNGVVLMDQIDEELKKGDDPYHAVVDASVERMRPVTVAAMTVIVGMIPLLQDPLFDSMATAIMFGLIFATVLTLFIVPIFYTILFRIRIPKRRKKQG
ncbi:MAG: efflux RND transporter permease subunit [Thermoguttaceae bacterium]|nr:efflux RND transporter permease subunit [Thermoguttaceae bacterium]